MIIPVPQQPQRFEPISPEAARRVRRRTTLVGVVLLPLSVVLLVVGVGWAFLLPTADIPVTYLLVGMVIAPCLFTMILGVGGFATRNCASNGWFNVTNARAVLRMTLVFLIGTIMTCLFGLGLVALMVSSSHHPPLSYTPEIVAYMVFLLLPAVASALGWRTLRKALRG